VYAVILAGGSGTRLWPLSRELFPKQYLPMPMAAEKSLFQATFERVTTSVPPEKILVVTHRDQAGEVRRQLDAAGLNAVRVLKEPAARNTAPAIGLAANFLQQQVESDAVMAVLPSDHLIKEQDKFSRLLKDGEAAAKEYGLVTFGIEPGHPETGYGYICSGKELQHNARRVEKFVEKPDYETAKSYLEAGNYLWNSGMFVFKVSSLLEQYRTLLPQMSEVLERIDYTGFTNLEEIYKGVEKISIDYGILERSPEVTVIPADIGWSDLGSWEAYYQAAPKDEKNNYTRGRVIPVETENSLVISGSRLVGTAGLKNLVVVETADAVLVCSRAKSQEVKQIVDHLIAENATEAREHRTDYRPWGSYTSLERDEKHQVKRINVNPGSRLSLQSHRHRSENWIVVSGEALVTVDDQKFMVCPGERAFIPAGARHRIENKGEQPLIFIEVQSGEYLGEDDIIRYEDDYGRSGEESASAQAVIPAVAEDAPSEAKKRFKEWLAHPYLEPGMRKALEAMKDDPEAIKSHFGSELTFGTGGMRGVIGPGLNRFNTYIVRRATQGLADYLNSLPSGSDPGDPDKPLNRPGVTEASNSHKVAIAYDTRRHSGEFAEAAALVLAANGIKAVLFPDVRPTPMLSFTTRELGCSAGIVITASHNPPEYNGYKVYGPDGGQAVSPLVDHLMEAIGKVDIFNDVHTISKEKAQKKGLLEEVDPALDRSYLEKVRSLSLSEPQENLKTVFTPLHGTGEVFIPALLAEASFIELHPVEEQSNPDPNFSTVKGPNPEDPAALDMALEQAKGLEADLVLATDPDGDRVGTAVRDRYGRYQILSGNQVGALLVEYICHRLTETGKMPEEPVMITTIVTGKLGSKIAESYGLQVIETLTGFKFIGDKMKEFERSCKPNFVFGYEESVGYLFGTFVRDKDAIISSYLISEMAAYYKEQGKNLLEVLDEVQKLHGYHCEDLFTVELKDITEADRHVAAYHDLPKELAGKKIVEKKDYQAGRGVNYQTGEEFTLTLPQSMVLHYTLEDGSWFAVRPSGTEPKVKFYISVPAPTFKEAEQNLSKLKEAVLERK